MAKTGRYIKEFFKNYHIRSMSASITLWSAQSKGPRYSRGNWKIIQNNKYINSSKKKDLGEVEELDGRLEHIHTILSIPPKCSVSSIMGFLKSKISLELFHHYEQLGKRYGVGMFGQESFASAKVVLTKKRSGNM